jgi:hypothetical protein
LIYEKKLTNVKPVVLRKPLEKGLETVKLDFIAKIVVSIFKLIVQENLIQNK